MKKIYSLALTGLVLFSACTKNTTNTTVINQVANPAYVVSGISDQYLKTNGAGVYTSTNNMPITIMYEDSTQQTVTVSVSGIPDALVQANSTTNGQVITGIPTFTFFINFLYDYHHLIPAGTYPITVTVVGSLSGTKTYTFNLTCY